MPGVPVLIGGMNLDVQAVPAVSHTTQPGGTVPGQIKMTSGGVARNVAECLASLLGAEGPPLLVSVIGKDRAGDLLLQHWGSLQLPCEGILQKVGVPTSMTSYTFDQGGGVAASVADVRTVEDHLKPSDLQPFHSQIQDASIVMLDANLCTETLEAACQVAKAAHVPVWFEPVSVPKSIRASRVLDCLTYISPNAHELIAMATAVDPTHSREAANKLLLHLAAGSSMSAASQLHALAPFLLSVLKAGCEYIMLTLGSQGAALCTFESHHDDSSGIKVHHLSPVPAKIVNTNGAGDCVVAGALACLVRGSIPLAALAYGMAVAQRALEDEDNVPFGLSYDALTAAAQDIMSSSSIMSIAASNKPAHSKL